MTTYVLVPPPPLRRRIHFSPAPPVHLHIGDTVTFTPSHPVIRLLTRLHILPRRSYKVVAELHPEDL